LLLYSYIRIEKSEKLALVISKINKNYLINAVLNPNLFPICPKFTKEGGVPIDNQNLEPKFVSNMSQIHKGGRGFN